MHIWMDLKPLKYSWCVPVLQKDEEKDVGEWEDVLVAV